MRQLRSTSLLTAATFTALVFTLSPKPAAAQVARGDFFYYGGAGQAFNGLGSAGNNQEALSAGFARYGSSNSRSNDGFISVGLGGGTFVSDRLSLGLSAALASFDAATGAQLSPEARVFFNPGSTGLNWFVDLTGTVNFVESDRQFGAAVGVGFQKRLGGGGVALRVTGSYGLIWQEVPDLFGRDPTFDNVNVFGITAGYTSFASRSRDREGGGEGEAAGAVLSQRRGAWLLGGQALTLAFVPQEDTKTFVANVQARGLWMASTRLAVGGGVGVDLSRTKSENQEPFFRESINTNRTIVINPTARYYFSEGKRSTFFVQAGGELTFGKRSFEFDGNNQSANFDYAGGSVYPAFALAIGPNVALEIGPELSFTTGLSDDTDDSFSTYRLRTGLQYTIGGK